MTDYASVILVNLSDFIGEGRSASDVSEAIQVAYPTVSKILKLLHKAGLVCSQRGVNGGYLLARCPAEITLAQLMDAVDNPTCLTGCSGLDSVCEQQRVCAVSDNWKLINQVVQCLFESVTVADLGADLTLCSIMKKMIPDGLVEVEDVV